MTTAVSGAGHPDGLIRCLKTVAVLVQQFGHGLIAGPEAVALEQLGRERVRALASPAQGRLWVTSRQRIDELFKCRPNIRLASSTPSS